MNKLTESKQTTKTGSKPRSSWNGRGSRKGNTSSKRGKPISVDANLARKQTPHPYASVEQLIDQATFIVFDLETTGGNPERNGITEICALKVKNGVLVDRFHTLVNPMIPIPPIVRKMTGITNQMVEDAPVIHEVYPDFAEFIQDHVLVSHNTIGDLIFLRHFCKESLNRELTNFFLCTHLLIEKLCPEAPDKSLKGLTRYFAFPGDKFHRAEADAIQTWELFKVLSKKLKERGIVKIEHAIRLQGDLDSSLRLGWSVAPEKLKNLPQGPGVFYLYDHERRLLFLSGASSLQKDVARLQRYELLPRQILKLTLKSYDLQVARSPSLFAALMAECDGLDKHRLSVDPSLLHQRLVNVIGIYEDRGGAYRVSVGPLEEGVVHAFGPVKDRKLATDLVEDLAFTLQEKVTRSGMLLASEHRSLILGTLMGTLPEILRKVERNLWTLRIMFWRKRSMSNQQERLEKIQNLLNMGGSEGVPWPHVMQMHGIIIVPDEGTSSWMVHSIVNGIPRGVQQVRGDWRQKLEKGGLGRRILRQIYKEICAIKDARPPTKVELARINAVQWWLQFGMKRDGGEFIGLSQFELMMKEQTAKG